MKTLSLLALTVLASPSFAQQEARKVERVPPGYTFVKAEGTKNFYHRVLLTALPPAQKGAPGASGKKYKQFVIDQLAAGITPEELVEKKYIAPGQVELFRKYYKRAEDVVFTESDAAAVPVKPTDAPAEAFMGEILYGPDQHAIALTRFQTRASAGKADGGMLDTAKQDVLLVFVDMYGRPDFSKGRYRIPADEFSNKYTGGVRTLRTQDGLDKYKVERF